MSFPRNVFVLCVLLHLQSFAVVTAFLLVQRRPDSAAVSHSRSCSRIIDEKRLSTNLAATEFRDVVQQQQGNYIPPTSYREVEQALQYPTDPAPARYYNNDNNYNPAPAYDDTAPAYDDTYTYQYGTPERSKMIWDDATPVRVQGGSLRTFSIKSPLVERAEVILKTDGRPLNVDLELWQGPNNSPVKMEVYSDNGSSRPFISSIETPGDINTIAIRNKGQLEFPVDAGIVVDAIATKDGGGSLARPKSSSDMTTIQGGSIYTFALESYVQSVQVLLQTDGRPLNARIELLQGPNNDNQVIDLYTENGIVRPFYMVVETPGSGNTIRIVNTAPVAFPLSAWVEPYFIQLNDGYTTSSPMDPMEPIMGGGNFHQF